MDEVIKRTCRFIIADDHMVVRQGMSLLVKETFPNAIIFQADNFTKIKGILIEEKIDVLILDVSFPEGNSISLLQEVKQIQPDCKIMIFSALEEEVHALHFYNAGVHAYLNKLSEEEIIQRNEPAKAQILGLLNEMDKIARLKEEIVQGHNAGKNALQYLDQVAFHLKEAIKWGDWDMTSNNRYYDHMKHNSLDTAIDNAYKAKHALTIFNNELADVGYNNNSFGLNVEAFTKFSDVFFDNLISDWIVQSKIKNVYSHVDMVKDKVLRMVQTLESDFDQAKLKFESLVKHKDELLINR